MKRADVKRPGVAKRDRPGARRERIVDVDDVEVDAAEQVLERRAEVDRYRSCPRTWPPGHRETRPNGKDGRAPVASSPLTLPRSTEQRGGAVARREDRAQRLADRGARSRRRGDRDAMAPIRQPS